MDTDVLTAGCLYMKNLEVQDNKPFCLVCNVALNCSCSGGQWRAKEFCSGGGGGGWFFRSATAARHVGGKTPPM